MHQLIVVGGPDSGKVFDLVDGAVIGRDRSCQVAIDDASIAERHVRFALQGGTVCIEAVAAGAPMSVNGAPSSKCFLKHGDFIGIGGTRIIFNEEQAVEMVELAPQEEDELRATTHIRKNYGSSASQLLDVIRRFDSTRRNLLSVIRIHERVHAFEDIGGVLDKISEVVLETFPADRCTALLFEDELKKFRIASSVAKTPGGAGKPAISRGILREVYKTRESLLLEDALTDSRFDMRGSVAEQHIRSAMAVPIQFGDTFHGILYVDSISRKDLFYEEDLALLSAIGSQAGLLLEKAKMAEREKERTRLEHDMELAAEIQRHVLPSQAPSHPDLDVFGTMRPAAEVGGDFYDFIPDGKNLFVAVGDVSGKGVYAALVMMMARSALKPILRTSTSPREILAELNHYMVKDTLPSFFITFVLLRWSGERKEFVFSGAGHENLFFWNAAASKVEEIPAGGIALGIYSGVEEKFTDRTLALGRDDVLLLYSDGVTEAEGKDGEFFGGERLGKSLARHASKPPREIVESILQDVKAFSGSRPQRDDITIVAAKRRVGA